MKGLKKLSDRFPFVAIIGQEKIKKALILCVINHKIGGVLISGEKGTAKSTAVRALEDILTDKKIVELPLNITEDNLVGDLDIEKVLINGKKQSYKGLLDQAKGNILYIDEVNLISKIIENHLLNSFSTDEKEGFTLVGTMNPEEGQINSHFLDRFGLFVEAVPEYELNKRVEIVKQRLLYEKSPSDFCNTYREETKKLLQNIEKAKEIISKIEISDRHIEFAASMAKEAGCEGHRADIILVETAKAIAALDQRDYMTIDDLREASTYVFVHRLKDNNQNENNPQDNQDNNNQDNDNNEDDNNQDNSNDQDQNENNQSKNEELQSDKNDKDETESNHKEQQVNVNDLMFLPENFDGSLNIFKDFKKSKNLKKIGSGKRLRTISNNFQGRYIRYTSKDDKNMNIALSATINAAVPYQRYRKDEKLSIVIKKDDIRRKIKQRRTGANIIFLVDASRSMGAEKRMAAVKGAVISMLTNAYENRDSVAVIAFRNDRAETLLSLTKSVELAKKSLMYMPVGGKTPLAEGLKKAYYMIEEIQYKDSNQCPILVLLSDCKANYSACGLNPFEEAMDISYKLSSKEINSIVIDVNSGFLKLGLAKKIAEALNSKYYSIGELDEYMIKKIIKHEKGNNNEKNSCLR